MNEIEKVMTMKVLIERMETLRKVCALSLDKACDGECIKCINAIDEVNSIFQKSVGIELIAGKTEQITEQPLSFSKRLAICRMFNHWFNEEPTNSKYSFDMFLISYLDKKGWLNTQKILDQLTDSRIRAILGEGVVDRIIKDDEKEMVVLGKKE